MLKQPKFACEFCHKLWAVGATALQHHSSASGITVFYCTREAHENDTSDQLPQTNPCDALPHAHRVVHRDGRSM